MFRCANYNIITHGRSIEMNSHKRSTSTAYQYFTKNKTKKTKYYSLNCALQKVARTHLIKFHWINHEIKWRLKKKKTKSHFDIIHTVQIYVCQPLDLIFNRWKSFWIPESFFCSAMIRNEPFWPLEFFFYPIYWLNYSCSRCVYVLCNCYSYCVHNLFTSHKNRAKIKMRQPCFKIQNIYRVKQPK